MKVFAYAAAQFEHSARRVAGVTTHASARLALSPPSVAETFNPHDLEADFLFVKLHGLPEQPYWYGDDWLTALRADQVTEADLSKTVVFVCNCFLPESPMLQALKDAGAPWIIGGHGLNYARPDDATADGVLIGPDLLALTMRRALAWGFPPDVAFFIARKRLRLKRVKDIATTDALQFEVFA